jgi:hypothetical protein
VISLYLRGDEAGKALCVLEGKRNGAPREEQGVTQELCRCDPDRERGGLGQI